MEEQLLLFSRRHDFTTCPPSPSRLMPRRLALGLSSPTHSPTFTSTSTPIERGYDPHNKPPMFFSSSSSRTTTTAAPAAQKMPVPGPECEQQSPAQAVVERLELHLHSVLPLPSTSSISSLASFSSLFVSPPSSPTISRLLSGSAASPPPASPPVSLSSFLAASLSSSSSSSPSGSPPSSPSTFAPSKLTRSMKKHVRPSKEEKEYFKHLFGQHHAGTKKRKSSGGKSKSKDKDAPGMKMMMDDEEVEEWREQLEQFEVSKYFVGSAATSSSRARWQTALMLAYRDANKLSSATESTKRSDHTKHQKRRNSKRGLDLLPKKQHDVYNRDRGDELQAAARLVVEMNHLWDVAQQLMQGKIDVARLRRAKDSATWTLIDIPSPKTTTTGSPSSASAASKCQSSGDKATSFRFTLMSSIGYFANSVLPSAPSPPSSPSLPANAVDPKRRPSLAPAASSSPPSLEETMTFGCPSFPSTPGTARLRPRPRPEEAQASPTETRKVTMAAVADEAFKRRQPRQLSVAEGEVVALLLADLVVKQMAYELCLAGTLTRVMADAQ